MQIPLKSAETFFNMHADSFKLCRNFHLQMRACLMKIFFLKRNTSLLFNLNYAVCNLKSSYKICFFIIRC